MTAESTKNPSTGDNGPSASSGGGLRKLLLLAVLLVVLGLFGYDQFVTKSDFNDTVAEIGEMQILTGSGNNLSKKGDHDGDGFVTASDVKFTAGRRPSSSEKIGDSFLIETYSWSRVIPGMTYKLFAVYRKGEERNVLFSVSTVRPDEADLPNAPKIGETSSSSGVGNLPNGGQRPDGSGTSDDQNADDDSPADASENDGNEGDQS